MDHHNPQITRLASRYVSAVRRTQHPSANRHAFLAATRDLLSAYSSAREAGIAEEELMVLAAAAGNSFSPPWAKDYLTRSTSHEPAKTP